MRGDRPSINRSEARRLTGTHLAQATEVTPSEEARKTPQAPRPIVIDVEGGRL